MSSYDQYDKLAEDNVILLTDRCREDEGALAEALPLLRKLVGVEKAVSGGVSQELVAAGRRVAQIVATAEAGGAAVAPVGD